MAQKLITYANLQTYDGLIKQYIATEQGKDIKTVLFDSTNKQIKFYKKEDATLADTAAYTIDIPSNLDGNATIATVSSGVVIMKGGVLEQDGIVSNAPSTPQATVVEGYLYEGQWYEEDTHTTPITLETDKSYKDLTTNKVYDWDGTNLIEILPDVVFAKVATTGTAADVAIVDASGYFTSDQVEGALAELAQASSGGVSSKTCYVVESSGGAGDNFSKQYSLYQGANGSSADPDPAEKLVDINIPKDMFCEEGAVVDITYDSATQKLYDGLVDVTEIIKGSGVTPTADDAGKYIRLTIANATSDKIYIKATDLVDIYTANNQTSEITITIDNNNNITALVGEVSATKSIYRAAAPATYEQLDNTATFDTEETYYVLNGETYEVDSTVTAENFATKIASGLYIEDTPAVAKQTVKAKLDELDYEVATASDINHLFD